MEQGPSTAVDEANIVVATSDDSSHARLAAPIEKLDQDLLWAIFMMNTDMEKDQEKPPAFADDQISYRNFRALSVLRCSSQVCQLWRNIVLSSSGLWGRVIDLHLLGIATSRWAEEVLYRSGQASLWVKGDVGGRAAGSHLVEFLDIHWSRIRMLRVQALHSSYIPPRIWNILNHPFPHPITLNVEFVTPLDHRLNPLSLTPEFDTVFRLFDDVPLRQVEFDWPGVSKAPQPSWLSHIRRLNLGAEAAPEAGFKWPVPEIARIVMHMPLLDFLVLTYCFVAPNQDYRILPSKRFAHPRLGALYLEDSLETCNAFLEHFDATPTTCLDLFVQPGLGGRGRTEEYDFHQHPSIVRFTEAYFNLSRHPLSLNISCSTLEISDLQEDRFPVYGKGSFFRVVCFLMIWEIDLTPRFPLLSGCDFTKIRTFVFDMEFFDYRVICNGPELPISFYRVAIPLFQALSSVEVLETGVETLTFFDDLHNESFFPRLHTIKFRSHHISSDHSTHVEVQEYTAEILSFLNKREEEGHPIRALYFLQCRIFPDYISQSLHTFHPNIEILTHFIPSAY